MLAEFATRLKAELVVIDTQSKFLEGKEDEAPTSAAFYRHTLLPLKRLGVAVVILDHAGNDTEKPRGSSGKRDDVDVVWQLKNGGKDRIQAKRTHSRKRHEVGDMAVLRHVEPLRHEFAYGVDGLLLRAGTPPVDSETDALLARFLEGDGQPVSEAELVRAAGGDLANDADRKRIRRKLRKEAA